MAAVHLDEVGERLFQERVQSRMFPAMHEVVLAHQRRGHTVVMSSSALTIHAEPVARYLEIDHVLCNHFEVDGDGRLTGKIARPVIWGKRKADAVQQFCAGRGIDHPVPARDGEAERLAREGGSGLDPDISPAYARLQADRVARANHVDRARIDALIAAKGAFWRLYEAQFAAPIEEA